MLLGTGDSLSQLDCKALSDIEGSWAARQGIAYCPLVLDRRNKKNSDFLISELTQHQKKHSVCEYCTTVVSLQQPRMPQASCTHTASRRDCHCGTVINLPHHSVTGYHIKLAVFAKPNGQQVDSGYGTCSIPRLKQWGKDRAACSGWSDTNSHCGDIKLISKDSAM